MPVRAWGEKIPDEVQNTHSNGCAYFISDLGFKLQVQQMIAQRIPQKVF
jgi:hypothetical protein